MRPYCVSPLPIWASALQKRRLVTEEPPRSASEMLWISKMTTSIVSSKILHLLGPLSLNALLVQPIAFSRAFLHMFWSVPLRWSASLPKLTYHRLLLTIPSLSLFYNVAAPMPLTLIVKAIPIVWAIFIGLHYLRPLKPLYSSLWDTNYKKGGIIAMPNMKEWRIINNFSRIH